VPMHQLSILDHMRIPVRDAQPGDAVEPTLRPPDIVLDALIGYSVRGAPREPIASLIRMANASGRPLLALDIPSGMSGDSGEAYDPTIRAVATLTLASRKWDSRHSRHASGLANCT